MIAQRREHPTAPVLRLAVVGCGGAAVDVVRAASGSTAVRVVAVHDRATDRAADLGAQAGARVHRTLARLLADPDVDAVYIALPHDRLAATAIAALRAGRHVLVEKPLAIRARDVGAVRAASSAAGRSVGVLFELRHVGSIALAADLLRSSTIGAIRLVRIRTLIDKSPSYWSSGPTGRVTDPWRTSTRRAGGGVVLMNTVHQLDVVRWMTGLEVLRVAAETTAGIKGVEVEDVAVATLRLEGGALVSVVAAAHAPGATAAETIEIDGEAGSIRVTDPYARPARLDLWLRRPVGGHPAGRWIELEPWLGDPWAGALEAYAAAIAAGRPPSPGLDDAEAALATVLAIYRSARTARFVTVRRTFDAPPGRTRRTTRVRATAEG